MLMPAFDGVAVDRGQLVVGEIAPAGRGEVLFQLRDAAGADENRGHPLVPQRPGQRELGQGLAPGRGDRGQRANVSQGPFGNLIGR